MNDRVSAHRTHAKRTKRVHEGWRVVRNAGRIRDVVRRDEEAPSYTVALLERGHLQRTRISPACARLLGVVGVHVMRKDDDRVLEAGNRVLENEMASRALSEGFERKSPARSPAGSKQLM